MENNLIKAKSFGCLNSESSFIEDVSISFDTIQHSTDSKIKILVQIEPPEIYNTTEQIINNYNNFDLILSWNEDVLQKCPNSKEFIFGTCWINFENFKPDKKNEISFIMSNKSYAPGHRFRHEIWSFLNEKNNLNGFSINKIQTPPRVDSKNILFENAKFHIVVENTCRKNWITEKIIDCFATKTIPIYCGCPNIGDFFNEKGIIVFNTIDELNSILNNLSSEIYDNMTDILEENYEKSKKYYDFHSRVENEINNIILSKK
jgi:hypothetical protein